MHIRQPPPMRAMNLEATHATGRERIGVVVPLYLAWLGFCGVANAQSGTKAFMDYFQPTPTTCSPLSSATWGVAAVLPRDICNGMESVKGAAVAPEYYYWDGKVIRAKDGIYHLFTSSWSSTLGFGSWGSSDAVHSVSTGGILGPYQRQGFAYDNGPDSGDRHKGHNVSAVELPDGTYAVYVNEIVPFTLFTSSSLNGPWTNKGHATIDKNGVPLTIPVPGDQNLESNVSLVVRHDGNYEIIQRHGIIAISTTGLLGPYKVQQPTTTYPADQAVPSTLASVYPNRKTHSSPGAPQTPESTYVYAEDPVIWYSGGQYHVIYNYPDDRVAYHLTSTDGIHDWADHGVAYDPRQAQKLFSYVGDTTVNKWYKMERPGVVMDNGHITHFTFAVADVDKNNQIPANSNHGSKVVVVPFDGASFDADTGVSGSGGTGAGGSSSTSGTTAGGGSRASGGSSTAGGGKALGGSSTAGASNSAGASSTTGGNSATGGVKATGGVSPAGGSTAVGGSTSIAPNTGGTSGSVTAIGGRASTGGSTSAAGGILSNTGGVTSTNHASTVAGSFGIAGSLGTGGATAQPFSGGMPSTTGTSAPTVSNGSSDSRGCGCRVGASHGRPALAMLWGIFGFAMLGRLRRKTRR
jgi:MYXO-CTERM domain-containing protein